MKRIFVSAAEPSGDVLGCELVKALGRAGEATFFGLAGPKMRAAGVEPLARMEDVNAMGLIEVLGRLPEILRVRASLKRALETRPDAAIFIDAPDLHHPLGRYAMSLGVLSVGYVTPQVWAWRPGRAKALSDVFDQLLCLFEFEPVLFDQPSVWVGHPVVDRLPKRETIDPHLFGLAPGSRPQEIARMLGPFIAAAEHLREKQPRARFVLLTPERLSGVPSWLEQTYRVEALSKARGVLTKSGTITLELAVMGVPQVVAHRVHPMTYGLGRLLVRGIDHIAMPNILANKQVVPEFIQTLEPQRLASELLALPATQPVDLSALGVPGASDRAAAAVWHAAGAFA